MFVEHRKLFSFRYYVGNKAKGRISKRVFQEKKARQISEKRTFLTPWYAHVRMCSGGKKCSFLENLACFVFLKHLLWDSPFCLLPTKWHQASVLCNFLRNSNSKVGRKAVIGFLLGLVLCTPSLYVYLFEVSNTSFLAWLKLTA